MTEQTPTKGRIRDARGRVVTQLDPVMLHVLHRHSVIEAGALHDIVEDLEPGTARLRKGLILIVPAVIVMMVAGIGALYYVSDAAARRDLISTLVNPVIFGPNLVCLFVVPWIVSRQARLKQARFVMLKHRRCPHCGYNLRGLTADPADRATVCPECGCAWLIDDSAIADGLAGVVTPPADLARRRTVVLLVMTGLVLCGLALLGFMLAMRWR